MNDCMAKEFISTDNSPEFCMVNGLGLRAKLLNDHM